MKMTEVFIADTKMGVGKAVNEIFSNLIKSGPILKSSKEVYIKVNGIDYKKHAYTSPEVLEEVIKYLKDIDAKIYVMENSTQANMTRIVFAINGFKEVCEKTGAEIVYLDEEDTESFEFKGKPSIEDKPMGYNLKSFRLPKTIIKIMKNRDSITYINIPKLKTHSMAGVTLGIKNQWGFPQHADRGKDHNYNLHSKLVDVYEYIKPDITIIDGTEGTIHGHYPPTAWEDRLVKKFEILISGRDTLAVDVVGARIFGLTIDEVPHLNIANKRGLGEGDLSKIQVIGKNLDDYTEKYPWDLLQEFPENVMIVKGTELLCREGCQNNPLATLQTFAYDHKEKFKGGWFLVMGKGHDENIVELLKEKGFSKGLVAGYCAIDEVGEKLRNEFGKRKVFFSGDCNNLAETVKAILKLSGMTVFDLVSLSSEKLMSLIDTAKEHGSTALVPL
ncbi:MAG: DUF362 domain-containing protein [Candidatus Lokiarchaeota archaeon]|nr:DUF362 domain-containing protein [Candidatus Lokiarchaeota archaeon]